MIALVLPQYQYAFRWLDDVCICIDGQFGNIADAFYYLVLKANGNISRRMVKKELDGDSTNLGNNDRIRWWTEGGEVVEERGARRGLLRDSPKEPEAA